MEMNLGINFTPEMIANIKKQIGGGIMGKPKPKKKVAVKKTKPAAGRKQGQPVGGRGIDVKEPKPVAPKTLKASKPPTYSGIMASQEARDRQAAIAASDLYPEIQSANQALNKYIKEKHGYSENSAQSDPVYQKMVKDLFALRDQAAGGGSMSNTGTLNPDQYRLLKNENLMDDDDDFFEDTEGRFGQAGTVYTKDFSESIVDDVSAERAQLKRDAIAANLALGIDEPVGNVRDPNVGSINELFPDAPQAPTPPQLPEARETYIPRNILGSAFDPKDREAYAAKVQAQRDQMQPGGNIQSGGYPTAMNPLSAMPQTQFGGYGAQMPMQALNPYAGMATLDKKVDFFPDYVDAPDNTRFVERTGMGMSPKEI